MPFRTLEDLAARGQRVLLRADLNVPMQDGRVTDAMRIERLLPTIRELSDKGARVVVLSHFDRPKGKRVASMSLAPLSVAIADGLGRPVAFAEDCIGAAAEAVVNAMQDGDVALLENTRFHPGEEANDPAMARALAALGDAYVNDAFSAAHRAHASTEGVAHLLPAFAGRLMQAELEALDRALGKPLRPVVALVGGAKVSTKLDLLGNLVGRVDMLVIGGAMANTFLAAQGHAMGKSLQEPDLHGTAREILAKAAAAKCRVILPVDLVVAREFRANAPHETVPVTAVPADAMALDVGRQSLATLTEAFQAAKTVVWNGPLGAFETVPFDAATVAAARSAASLTETGKLLSVAGGGDTVAALRHAGGRDRAATARWLPRHAAPDNPGPCPRCGGCCWRAWSVPRTPPQPATPRRGPARRLPPPTASRCHRTAWRTCTQTMPIAARAAAPAAGSRTGNALPGAMATRRTAGSPSVRADERIHTRG